MFGFPQGFLLLSDDRRLLGQLYEHMMEIPSIETKRYTKVSVIAVKKSDLIKIMISTFNFLVITAH